MLKQGGNTDPLHPRKVTFYNKCTLINISECGIKHLLTVKVSCNHLLTLNVIILLPLVNSINS